MTNEIDITKHHLVLWRDSDGNFSHYQWYDGKAYQEDIIRAKIKEAIDATPSSKKPELVEDKLIKQICAAQKSLSEKYDFVNRINIASSELEDTIRGLDSKCDDIRVMCREFEDLAKQLRNYKQKGQQ